MQDAGTLLWLGRLEALDARGPGSSTLDLAGAVATATRAGAHSVAADEELAQALAAGGARAGFSHVSPCGDLACALLQGKELPGLMVLSRGAV